MSKMDEYFKKQLTNYTQSEEEDDWNLPSEKVWESALPHLPKKKERRRGLFFILGLGLTGLIALSYFISATDLNNQATAPIISDQSLIERNQELKEQSVAPPEISEIKTPDKPAKVQADESSIAQQQKERKLKTTNTVAKPNQSSIEPYASAENLSLRESTAAQLKDIKNTATSVTAINIDQKNQLSVNSTTLSEEEKSSTEQQSSSLSSTFSNPKATLLPLSLLPTASTSISLLHKTQLTKASKIILPLAPQLPKQEVGIASAKYLLHLLPALEQEIDEEVDSINIAGKIKSANLYYRKWLSPKWSIASGLYYTSADLEFYIDAVDTLSCNDLSVFVNQQFGSQITERESCISNSTNDDLELYLQDGVTVQQSDSLNFVIDADLVARAFQVPLMLTRHWKKKRVEYTVGIGASLDFIFYNQGEVSLDLRRDGVSILKQPYIQAPQKETVIDYGLYLDSGIRIPLYKNFNLGITSRINFKDLYLSGIEAGLFYRW